ncbi:LysR family transcriptional regulator [Psychromonas hadalis]|uniref:LysR family transcriptional regulator n=1 Tax=Psychromonas hadalis TaxID=211669 RepID=UPI0003B673A2|nr:LysR family transcriptional regulator [Psychromonas hadalis]
MNYSMAEIRAFNATFQTGSFTRAAELLSVSQPAITAQIRKLESRFSGPLLERFSKGVRVTELGKRLYLITQQYHDLATAIEALSNPRISPGKMTLKVANASSVVFMPLIAEFSRRFPLVTVKIKSVTTSECRELVLDRAVDIGLFPLMDEHCELSRFAFSSHRLVAILHPDHYLAGKSALLVRELAMEALIVYKPEACTQQLLENVFGRHQQNVCSNVVVDNRLDMLEAVCHGLGIGFSLEQDIRPNPRFVILPIIEATDKVIEHVVWIKNRRGLPGIRDFIQVAMESCT